VLRIRHFQTTAHYRIGAAESARVLAAYEAGGHEMTGRTELLEPAIRAQGALIVEAQREIERYLTKEIEAPELVNGIIRLFDGPDQREAARLAREALGEIIEGSPKKQVS
jgi:hypothetical protein